MVKPTEFSATGEPIYRYEDKTTEGWTPPHYGEEGWSEKIERHFEAYVGKVDLVFHEILSDTIHVDVYHIKPTPERNYHTLFTTGMSYLPMNTPEGLEDRQYAELMICLPPSWPISDEAFQDPNHYWPVRWLKMLARFVHDYNTWMCEGHTMPAGDPPAPLSGHTALNGIMLVHPLQVEPEFRILQMDENRVVHFYCIMPLYQEEMDFKLNNGSEALMKKLGKHRITEVIDLQRTNVCTSFFHRFWKK